MKVTKALVLCSLCCQAVAFLPQYGLVPSLRRTATSFSQQHNRQCRGPSWTAAAEVSYGGMQHAGVLVQDVEKSVEFYTEVLGMRDETHLRPNLPFDGAFIGCGTNQIHLMQLPDPDPREGRPEHGGRDRHVAITVANIDPLKERLEANDVIFTMSKSGRRAVFCRDLDMNAIEFVEDTSIAQ